METMNRTNIIEVALADAEYTNHRYVEQVGRGFVMISKRCSNT